MIDLVTMTTQRLTGCRLDRNVYTDNVHGNEDAPDCSGGDATDQPGLKEMTLKAIDVL